MKEATGELNITVITVVAIAALAAFFYFFIWPTIKVNMALQSACSSTGANGGNVTLEDNTVVSCTKASGTGKITCSANIDGKNQSRVCE